MDSREQAFRAKLEYAASLLGTVPERVVSLKVCDDVGNHHGYQELLHALTGEAGLKSRPLDWGLQGAGHVIENSKTRILILEYETGLAMFYIAGSIASLLGLIPLVLKCWASIRGLLGHPDRRGGGVVEIRRLDEHGKLVEDRSHGLTFPWEHSPGAFDNAFMLAAEKLDAEVHALKGRLVALEEESSDNRPVCKPPDLPK